MPVYTGLVTIKRNGRFHPPGALHEFDESEAAALGAKRLRLHPDQSAIVPAPVPNPAVNVPAVSSFPAEGGRGVQPPTGPIFETESQPHLVTVVDGDVPSAEPLRDAASADGASERVVEIMHALDLLDDTSDYVKTGVRAGTPKLKPLEDILGYSVTDDEIIAAQELHREMMYGD
jgi:hypothetical protein